MARDAGWLTHSPNQRDLKTSSDDSKKNVNRCDENEINKTWFEVLEVVCVATLLKKTAEAG